MKMFSSARLHIFAEAAVIALAGLLVCVAPYWFPPGMRLLSASYVFGFNNRVAVFALASGAGALAVIKYIDEHYRVVQQYYVMVRVI